MFDFQDKVSYLRWQTKVWIAFVVIFGIVWLVLWFQSEDPATPVLLKEKAKQAQVVKMPTKIDKLTELFAEVAPVKFETITRDLRSYPPEFKDKKYFEQNSKKWAVEVMKVAEHKVILDYLDTRPDRDKFAYFRYTDGSGNTRYVLTYGMLSSFQEAMGATKMVDFRLPNHIRVVPEEFRRYAAMIDDYERVGAVVEGGKNQPREIRLSPTQYEIPVAPRPPAQPKENKENKEKPKTQRTNNGATNGNGEKSAKQNTNAKPEKKKTPSEEFAEAKARAESEARKKASETGE